MNILVTGGSGQVGRELKDIMPNADYVSSKDVNLLSQDEVYSCLNSKSYDIIVHLAAKVGGIIDNIENPNDYLEDNLIMNSNILKAARLHSVPRFIGVLSTCIYPNTVENYPIQEADLHNGPPTPTNLSYGIAKRAMAVHIDSINQQYGFRYCYVTPCNLYGKYDKFCSRAHFVAHLIQKIHNAKIAGKNFITLFGSGKPLRQFMNAADFARVLCEMIEKNINSSFNVASPKNISINEIAEIAIKALDCEYLNIKYDSSKPDGQFRKDGCTKKFSTLFPDFKFTGLEDGIRDVYKKVFNS